MVDPAGDRRRAKKKPKLPADLNHETAILLAAALDYCRAADIFEERNNFSESAQHEFNQAERRLRTLGRTYVSRKVQALIARQVH